MNDWTVIQPRTVAELAQSLANSTGRIIAGGTDVLPALRREPEDQPVSLIDISRLTDMKFIREADGELEMGALCTHDSIIRSDLLRNHAPALVEACVLVGAPQTRARGTVGGNLVNASPAADCVPPLLCHESRVKLVSISGERQIPLTEFLKGPGKTALKPGEFLYSVTLTKPAGRWGAGYLKLGRRNGMAIAVVSTGVYLCLDEAGLIETIRVALGSVGPVAVRARQLEAALKGSRPSADLFSGKAGLVDEDISPISDVRATAEYRRNSARVLVTRALESAWKQAESRLV